MNPSSSSVGVRDRLLRAALECFLADDYHRVTTRQIAAKAQTNIAMIRYYFGSKQDLYQEVLRETLKPLIELLSAELLSTPTGLADFFHIYYQTMSQNPEFPKLIIRVLAFNQGPGRQFVSELLSYGRSRGTQVVNELKHQGTIDPHKNPDMLRIIFVSLAFMPMLLKEFFEQQIGHPMDEGFINELAHMNGHIFAAGLGNFSTQITQNTESIPPRFLNQSMSPD